VPTFAPEQERWARRKCAFAHATNSVFLGLNVRAQLGRSPRREAQTCMAAAYWIPRRSLSSGAHSRDPWGYDKSRCCLKIGPGICAKTSNRRQLEHDDYSSNRHPALAYWWSMIFSEDRYPLFGIML
jgi:hypothetical protein